MSSTVEVVYQPVDSVDVVNQSGAVVEISQPAPVSIEVSLVNQGPRGPVGPRGPAGTANMIGDYPVSLSSPAADDVLAFNGTSFVNRPQIALTDGGNF